MSAKHQLAPVAADPPDYFHGVRERASKRWDQLEADPELAGPWHQLFKQVQSPRHILSELLQNADDAGASEARVSIEDDRFVFEHNGEDFIEAHFASICRFGYSHLHDWVKRKTADFRQLSADTVRNPPFSSLQALSDLVEERFNQPPLCPGLEDRRAWLTAFGTQLARIELADPVETERVRAVATAIAATSWVAAPKLEVIPYLDGVPAGTARLTDILWLDRKLFVSPLSKAKLAKRVPEEIGKSLSADIRAALAYAFERPPEDIKDYLEENFTLGPERQAVAPVVETQPVATGVDGDAADAPSEDTRDDAAPVGDAAAGDEADLAEDDDEPAVSSEQDERQEELEGGLPEPEVVSRPRPPVKPPRPSVMARFAVAQGYKADGEDRFFHADGSWIGRANGARFPWERRSAGGEVLRHYYPKDHCLEREPLQIEADIWGLLDQKPDVYSFILVNTEGEPVEMTGARLRALREGGEITIHPATYRLVYDLDE